MTGLDDRVFVLSEGLDPARYVIATYLFQGPGDEDLLNRSAMAAIEQTVGRASLAEEAYADMVAANGGKVLSLFRVPDHECKRTVDGDDWVSYIARVAFPVENTGYQIPMLLTALMSDLSMGGVVKLLDIDLPSTFVDAFQGPKFGLPGIRAMLKTDRPLVCSILKPCVGVSAKDAADFFYQHALGGADVIKDDELMVYSDAYPMEARIKACMEAGDRAFDEIGKRPIYLVSITDRPDRVVDNARRAIEAGANGLMITPLTTGISTLRMLAEDPAITVPVFAHPSMLGAMSWSPDFGISGHILVAKLFRLAGADINAIPVPYGRFVHMRENYIKILKLSKAPMRSIKPTFSQVGGGMHAWRVPDVIADVGTDVMMVIGGAAQSHPMGLAAGIRVVQQAITATLEGRTLVEAAEDYEEIRAGQPIWGSAR